MTLTDSLVVGPRSSVSFPTRSHIVYTVGLRTTRYQALFFRNRR